MGRSQETFKKKEVRSKKEKKRKDKEKKRLERKETEKKGGFENMLAYVDENGMIVSTPPDPGRKKEIKPEDIEISTPTRIEMEVTSRRTGTVSFFNESKGYGFIRDSETRESVFIHINNLEDRIKEGDMVSYELERSKRGPSAIHVQLFKPE